MNVVIVGANRGIGLELVKQYAARADVVAVCRNASDALSATGVRIEAGVDVTREEDVTSLVSRLQELSVDVVIHNAGVLERVDLDDLRFDVIRRQFEVNALGPLRVVAALRGRMPKGAKVGLLTSRMGSIADNTSGSHYGYRMSKAALNMAGVSLAHDLKGDGISVAILHPGYVRTDMTGGTGQVEPADAARGLIARMEELTLDTSGTFWHANGEQLPW